MDALSIRALSIELNHIVGMSRIEKVHQPTDRDLVLTLRTKDGTHRLLLSAHKSFARAHLLTGERPKNPEEPPMFCMLLRKRVEAGRIVSFEQQGFDRVLHIVIQAQDEIGDTVYYVLILEAMGKHSNLILTTADDQGRPKKIVDSMVRVTRDMSRVRQVLPGLDYTTAPPQEKRGYRDVIAEDVAALELDGKSAKAQCLALCSLIAGIGPTTAKEILWRANLESAAAFDPVAVVRETKQLMDDVLEGKASASVGLDDLGIPVQAAPYELTSYPSRRQVDSLSEAIQSVHTEISGRLKMSNLARDLEATVLHHLDRLRGKRQKLLEEQTESADYEEYRIKGELLTAYSHLVNKGLTEVTLPNFYNEEQPLTIAVDPALTAMQNAQRYFKYASKKKRGLPLLEKELADVAQDGQYLENVLVYLEDASLDQLKSLEEELIKEGFLREKSGRTNGRRKTGRGKMPSAKAKDKSSPGPKTYLSTDGYTLLVGSNNVQNDKLTLRTGQPHDVWLHVKDTPGSHVVIRADKNKDVPEKTLEDAAILAAFYSKAKNSANVPVDYTLVKHVWKPNGARPGFVLYDHQRTLFVTPDRERLGEIFARPQA